MSGGLKQQWGVDVPAEVGSDAQSQALKNDFEPVMDAICSDLQAVAAQCEPTGRDALAGRRDGLVQSYQGALKEIDPDDEAKAKASIDKLLADARTLQKESAEFRSETERLVAEWEARRPDYETGLGQLEEMEGWQHPQAAALRGPADTIRAHVNEHGYAKAVEATSPWLADLKSGYDDYQRQKAAQAEYEPALAALQPRLGQVAQPPRFKKLTDMQAGITSAQSEMESAAQTKNFVSAVEGVKALPARVDEYVAADEQMEQARKDYEQVRGEMQPKLDAAPNPSPFNKLSSQLDELNSGKQQMESSATAEDFQQAAQSAKDLLSKADAYTVAVEELKKLKEEYETSLKEVQPKLDAAPTPSPFNKLSPQLDELNSGKQQMESSATAEDFQQAAQSAKDLLSKADAYTVAVEELKKLKDEYETSLKEVQPKLDAAPNPSPFNKLSPQLDELNSGKQQMESSATAEDFQQAAQSAKDLLSKADAYTVAVEELKKLKEEYETSLKELQPKLDAAPTPSPFNKLSPQLDELNSGKQQMESSATAEDFQQAAQSAKDLLSKADAYTVAVEELKKLKEEYETSLKELQPKLDAAPSPSPFNKLSPQLDELNSGKQQMESSATAEDFQQAAQSAKDLLSKADAYTVAVEELKKLKEEYETSLKEVQPKLDAAPNPSPFNKLSPQLDELNSGKQQMESAASAEDFQQAAQSAKDLLSKADAYTVAVEELKKLKDEYEASLKELQPKLDAAPNPSPFNKLSSQLDELNSGKQQMESSASAEDFQQAAQSAKDLLSKADVYTAEVQKLQQAKDQYEQALATLQSKLQAAPDPAPFKKLEPMRSELSSGQQQLEASARAEDFEQALNAANELNTKVDAYNAEVQKLQQAKDHYEQVLATLQPKLQGAPNPSPFKKLQPMQAELAAAQQQMEASAAAEDFEQAQATAQDLSTKVDAYVAAIAETEQQKKAYDDKLAALQPRLVEALEAKDGKPPAAQAELVAAKTQMEEAAQRDDYEQALKMAGDITAKLDAQPKTPAPAAGGGGKGTEGTTPAGTSTPADTDSGKLALTFEIGPVDHEFGKWGQDSYVAGSFKVKGKGKGELVEKGSGTKTSIGSSTDGGVKADKELAVQKAKELGSGTWKQIFETLKIKEMKESFKDELTAKKVEIAVEVKITFESSVPWLSPIASVKLVLAGAEWEKIKKDPNAFTAGGVEISGGVEAKGSIPLENDIFDTANVSVEFTAGGSVKLNWPVILRKMVEKYGEEALKKVAQEGAKEVAKQGAKEVAKQGAKEVAKQGAKEAAKGAAEGAAEGTAEGAATTAVEAGVILDAAITVALAAVAIGTIAGVADAFVQRSQNLEMRVGVNTARASLMAGLYAGLAGEASAAKDPLYDKGWAIGHEAYTKAIAKLYEQPNLPPPDEIAAAARDAAKKAANSWKGVHAIDNEIRWSFFRKWVEDNHGLFTFKGAAQDAVLSCFGIAKEPSTGPHMKYWVERSSLPDDLKS